MKRFLQWRSKRWGYDGWAVKVREAPCPLDWTVCTSREEAREIKKELAGGLGLNAKLDVVRVRLDVSVVSEEP